MGYPVVSFSFRKLLEMNDLQLQASTSMTNTGTFPHLHKLHSKGNFLSLGVKFAKRWQTSSSAAAWNPGCDPEDIVRKSPNFTSHIIYATCFLLSERIPLPHTARQRIKSIKQSPNQIMSWCFDNGTPLSAQSLIPGAGVPLVKEGNIETKTELLNH